MQNFLDFVAQTLLGELLVVIAGILITQFLRFTWVRWRYGGWRVHIIQGGQEILKEEIPATKAKEVLDDPISLRIYLKGLVSGYAWLHGDLLTDGKASGLYTEDFSRRRFTIDLDKNPPQEHPDAGPPVQTNNPKS